MTSILRREEIILLTRKYLPEVFRPYKRVNDRLSRITEKIDDAEGDIWLTEQQQKRLIREIYRDTGALALANNKLRIYLRQVFQRLEETPP